MNLVLFGFVKCAGICGSCGKDDELRFGSCFACAGSVKVRHRGDGTVSARNTKSGKTWIAKTHGPAMQECTSCGKPKTVKDGVCSSCSFFAGKRKKVASKRTPLPRCVKCGGPGGQYPTAVCKKCGYDGKPPKERRRSKKAGLLSMAFKPTPPVVRNVLMDSTGWAGSFGGAVTKQIIKAVVPKAPKIAGLARRFRLNLAVQKGIERGGASPALHAANEMASMKVQRRMTGMAGKGIDHYIGYSESRGVLHDAERQHGLRSRILGHAGVPEPSGMKHAAFWRPPHGAFPYRGDLKVIALNPESGMTTHTRETLLDEHYRRMSAERRPNLGEAAVGGAFHGGAFGAAVTAIRAAAGFRSSGMSLKDSLKSSIGPAAIGGAIGAGLGIPAGIFKGYMRSHEIGKAQAYTGSDLSTRRSIVRAEVNHALGVG